MGKVCVCVRVHDAEDWTTASVPDELCKNTTACLITREVFCSVRFGLQLCVTDVDGKLEEK